MKTDVFIDNDAKTLRGLLGGYTLGVALLTKADCEVQHDTATKSGSYGSSVKYKGEFKTEDVPAEYSERVQVSVPHSEVVAQRKAEAERVLEEAKATAEEAPEEAQADTEVEEKVKPKRKKRKASTDQRTSIEKSADEEAAASRIEVDASLKTESTDES